MPPYIVFSDKTLIDMCAKLPSNEQEMLGVSGVGTNKFDKYGKEFLKKIAEFMSVNPDAVISMPVSGGEDVDEFVHRRGITKKKKVDFYLPKEDIEKFEYKDLYYITEIKDELNRICSADDVKKIVGTRIWDVLAEKGLVGEKFLGGISQKYPTSEGKELGIVSVDKESAKGNHYTVLMYPPSVQKMIVEYYANIHRDDE